MTRRAATFFLLASVAMGAAGGMGCAQEDFPALGLSESTPEGGAPVALSHDASVVDRGPAYCDQAHAQALPARLAAMGAGGPGGGADGGGAPTSMGQTWLVQDLFQQYTSICGRCHGSVQGLGGFQLATMSDFTALSETRWNEVLMHVESDGNDPNKPNSDPMPPFSQAPVGKPFSQRDPNDNVWQFDQLVREWVKEHKPATFQYNLQGSSESGATDSTVPIPNASVGDPMTNIGNCIPSKGLVGSEQKKSAALDAMFAAARAMPVASGASAEQIVGLPAFLSDTDLFTLDSATLARYGVIGYAPGYPLWSDNAGKLRYIRVPRGTSVVFDKATQSFTIPPNTRFYKTFMKQVVDTNGSLRYRKIETRLIVSRPDEKQPDGTMKPVALFGSYRWTDDESKAKLVTTGLNSGAPFADTVLQYTTDEPLASDLLRGQPADPEVALVSFQAARHYAIPSSERCIQCHEGSESHSFVLGFLPLQINRRPAGQGGTIEPTGPDELTQMQRFIDYGLVTGMTSPADVLPLEEAEGSRRPRNEYELTAQGYMLGNCAHCHNPGGFPTRQNPVLAGVLDFYPTTTGGIFQFPLERTSPRIFRGITGLGPIPYITPSLMDQPTVSADEFVLQGADTEEGAQTLRAEWFAPWRSLIYRNVDNPFAYTDDHALFPHMPMDTPGYDDRARQIMSDWMVSIPAVRKRPDVSEYASKTTRAPLFGDVVDDSDQPYAEVLPGDPRYPDAVAAATQRLAILHTGVNPVLRPSGDAVPLSRYAEPGQTEDILDIQVNTCNPVPTPNPPNVDGAQLVGEVIPGHCHWVVTDTTQPPGDWSPRRPDWIGQLVDQDPAPPSTCQIGAAQASAEADAKTAVSLLQNVTLPPKDPSADPDTCTAANFLTCKMPFGLWRQKTGCHFSGTKTVQDLAASGQPLPQWIARTKPASDAPVYMSTPGQAVFKMICINCHGPSADASGRLAQNLATMTGGRALVADFRDGMFGPVTSPGAAIDKQFGMPLLNPADGGPASSSWSAATHEDRAARYMAWMALGGTLVNIPQGLLTIVGATPVLDQRRALPPPITSANMLSTAKALCDEVLGARPNAPKGYTFHGDDITQYSEALIDSNGDAELWMHLCALNNPPPIRVLSANDQGTTEVPVGFDPTGAFAGQQQYLIASPVNFPAGTPVGNDRGEIVPFVPDDPNNLWPWCVQGAGKTLPQSVPVCPSGALISDNQFLPEAAERWSVRGAINAGLAVFRYVQSLEQMSGPPPDYNECEKLP